VIGLSAAWRLARTGRHVVVIDPEPGRGAAWVAAGMLAPANEAHFGEEPFVRLLIAGAGAWRGFADALEDAAGLSIGFLPSRTVVVAADASDRVALEELLRFRESLGFSSLRLSATECRRAVPALSPAIRGGAEVPGDHQVDNRRLVEALTLAADFAGVTMVRSEAVAFDADAPGALNGVRTASGERVTAPVVVLAMGWKTAALPGLPPGALPPVRPVKGHILRLAGATSLLDRTVRGLVHGRSCYLVPRSDYSVVVGATVEDVGEDLRVRSGAVYELLHDARSSATLAYDRRRPTTAPTSAGLRSTGWRWQPVTSATASCWRPSLRKPWLRWSRVVRSPPSSCPSPRDATSHTPKSRQIERDRRAGLGTDDHDCGQW
jgi:glycine oxidase